MAYAHVQKAKGDNSGGSQSSIATAAFGANLTAGNALAGMVVGYGTDPGVITLSGAGGQTWTKKTQFGDASNGFATLFYALNIAGGVTTALTATFTNAVNFPAIVVVELSGIALSAAEAGYTAQIDTTQSTTTDATTSGATGTLTGQPCAVLGFGLTANTVSLAAGSAFASGDRGTWGEYGGSVGGRAEDRRVTATTAVEGLFTLGTNDNVACAVLALLEATAGGGDQLQPWQKQGAMGVLLAA